MKETAPVLDSTAIDSTPAADDGQTTVLEALQASPLGPFLDLPLPQLTGLDALPQLPALPANPLEALLGGQALSALPGVDQLLKPITDLVSGFGTGVLGSFDPTALLQQASGLIDSAMDLGMGGLKVLDQIWQSDAAAGAQQQGRSAQASGQEVVTRGNDISAVTQDAAGAVQRGNAKLAAIAESFVASAVASAPLALTPPGQIALMSSAAEHLGQALEVVAETQAELTGHTTQMSTLSDAVPVSTGPSVSGTSPFAIASSVLENIGKPLVSTLTDTVEKLVESSSTHAASTTDTASTDAATRAASTSSYTPSTSTGPGFVPASTLSHDNPGQRQNTQTVVAPGVTATDRTSSSTTPAQRPATTVSTALGAGTGMGMMPPMMANRAGDSEVERTTPSELVTLNRVDAIGDLGTVVSPVLGVSEDLDDPIRRT